MERLTSGTKSKSFGSQVRNLPQVGVPNSTLNMILEAGICYNAETGEYSDSNTGKVYDPKKMEWVNPKKSDKPKKEKEGIIITKKKEKRKAEW